jgi:serine protease Do
MRIANIINARLLLISTTVFALAAICVLADLPSSQIENGKKATALVSIKNIKNQSRGIVSPETRSSANGTAFCIDAWGWFVTSKHVTDESADGKVNLILNANEKDQTIVEAKVVRTDKENDLALLKANEGGLFVALPLGKVDNLAETVRLTAFGYPFGEKLALDKGAYPAISVSMGAVTSLRKKDGKLEQIQLDASLNPGNSGGPVLDSEGRVVGVVNAGIRGAALNFAIPVNRLQEFLSVPDIKFIPPNLNTENIDKTITFKAGVLTVIGTNADYQAELALTFAGAQRKFAMAPAAGGFSAEAVPVPPRKGPATLSITAIVGDKTVSGTIADKSFTIAGKIYQLSKVQLLEGGSKPRVVMEDGTTVEGTIKGLSSIGVTTGGTHVTLDLSKVASATLSPMRIADSIEYQVAIKRSGKTVNTVSGFIPIATIAATPAPSAEPGLKVIPARAEAHQTEVKLPSDIFDVAVGGGGRFLIMHLRKLRQLAIFDTGVAKVVKYLQLDSDNIFFAAGAEKLIVVLADQNSIARYNLQTFEREADKPMPVEGTINAIAIGANSRGPLLVLASDGTKRLSMATFSLVDLDTMALKDTLLNLQNRYMVCRDKIHIRTSADGTVFCMGCTTLSPPGFQALIIEGDTAKSWHVSAASGIAIPSPDGRIIYGSGATYTAEGKLVHPLGAASDSGMRIPAAQGNLYLNVDPAGRIAICLAGEDRVLATIPQKADILGISQNSSMDSGNSPPVFGQAFLSPRQNNQLDRDKLIHFIPDARLIVTIPATKDRLLLQQFELSHALKESPTDYLLVSSAPVTTAARNSNYVYQIKVESKRGGVKFSLENGPAGMKITPTGKLTWTAGPKEGNETVIVRITDTSGQELFHAYKIRIK